MKKKITIALISCMAFYFIFIIFKFHYIGINVDMNTKGQWEVTQVLANGWGHQQNINKGDIILEVNGNPPASHSTIKKYQSIGKITQLKINSANSVKNLHVTGHQNLKPLLFHGILPGFIMFLMIIFSIYINRKKPNNPSSKILMLFLLSFGLSFLSAGASAREDILAKLVVVGTFLFIPTLLLHFFYTYFSQFNIKIISKRILNVFYTINGLLFGIQILFLFYEFGQFYSLLRQAELGLFMIGIILNLFIFIYSYIKYRKSEYRSIFKIISLGLFIAFAPFVFLYVIPVILFDARLIATEITSLFIVSLPITFFYLIISYRLFDIDFFIKRIYYYSFITIVPTVFFITIIYYGFQEPFTLTKIIQLYLCTHLILVILLYIKEEFDHRLRTKLFFEKYNYQSSLHQFANYLSAAMKNSEIEKLITNEVKAVLSVKNSALYALDKENNELTFKAGDNHFNKEALQQSLSKHQPYESIGIVFSNQEFQYVILGISHDVVHILALGEKRHGTKFNLIEQEWIKTISYYANISFENMRLINGLTQEIEQLRNMPKSSPWVSRLLFNIEEKERRKLASDLHDSALQDQIMWYRKVESLLEDESIPHTLRKELEFISEGLMDVIHEIRETCHELRPAFLQDMGITKSLKQLIQKAQLRNNFSIELDTSSFKAMLKSDQTLTMYRIIQELINNASKHSNASKLSITLTSHPNGTFLNYKDNGIGLEKEHVSPDNIGLSGIRERVRSLNGVFELDSTPGNGVDILIDIPLKEEINEQMLL